MHKVKSKDQPGTSVFEETFYSSSYKVLLGTIFPQGLWKGRKVYGPRGEPLINVKKGLAGPVDTDPYNVDGLSGATITSRGVGYLVRFWLGKDAFGPYLQAARVGGQS